MLCTPIKREPKKNAIHIKQNGRTILSIASGISVEKDRREGIGDPPPPPIGGGVIAIISTL
jgi:hypothetical protein